MRRKPVPLPTIIGHSHTPAIAKGTYTVGTSMPLTLGYNNPKTWKTGQPVRSQDIAATYRELYGGLPEHPVPRRREAIEHTRRKLGL